MAWRKMAKSFMAKLTDFLKTIVLILPKLPSKWFDWLKWILIIGAISAIEKANPDAYLKYIIYISYAAILIDTYHHTNNIWCKFFLPKIDNSLNQMHDIIRDDEESIMRAIEEVRSFILNDPNSYLEELEVLKRIYMDVHRVIESAKKLINPFGIAMAILVTKITYNLVNYIVNLYISSPKN